MYSCPLFLLLSVSGWHGMSSIHLPCCSTMPLLSWIQPTRHELKLSQSRLSSFVLWVLGILSPWWENDENILLLFYFICHTLNIVSKILTKSLHHLDFFCHFSRGFIVSIVCMGPWSIFELAFVSVISSKSRFILCIWISSYAGTTCWKCISFHELP